MNKKKINVGILFGGKSAEHEISLLSAKNIIEAIDKDKYQPVLIGIDKSGRWLLHDSADYLLNSDNPKLIKLNRSDKQVTLVPHSEGRLTSLSGNSENKSIDVIFPVMHGPFGEDGSIQGMLKMADLPFVGAGVLGSAIGMDKDVMKRLLRDAGIPIARFISLRPDGKYPDYDAVVSNLGSPFFIKPANMGSSVGVSRITSEEDFDASIKLAFKYDNKILIEENIAGREIECAVLGNDDPMASVPGEIIPKHDFYSYDAKYLDENGAELVVPARLSEGIVTAIKELSISAFKVLSCDGMARIDFFLADTGDLFVNEINTIPGFTSISMYPMLWQASGISYSDLIDRLIELAFERFNSEKRLSTDYES